MEMVCSCVHDLPLIVVWFAGPFSDAMADAATVDVSLVGGS